MSRTPITATDATAIGPYSHAIDADPMVYLSGQAAVQAATGQLLDGTVAEQTEQCLANLASVLSAAGLDESHAVKCNVYLVDMADFVEMNQVYAAFFSAPYPARTTIAVAALPLGAKVEIEMIARRPG
ncbi:MAG: Rid family detoxifying hydrolase [Ilumatobacteraceae bacterium]